MAEGEPPPPPPPGEECPDADVDPRGPGNPHPDNCEFSPPQGQGEDNVHIRRHMPDADESPNGTFTPTSNPDTREEFNMDVGFLEDDRTAPELKDDDELYDDEDMSFRFLLESIDAYLAPDDDPDSRWRRFCGTGRMHTLGGDQPEHFRGGRAGRLGRPARRQSAVTPRPSPGGRRATSPDYGSRWRPARRRWREAAAPRATV